jgi:uncharacterized membrane protein
MRLNTRHATLLTIAFCLCCATAAVGEPIESPAVPAMHSCITQELDSVKVLAEQLNHRIRRLEALLELDRARQARNAALDSWKQLHSQRDTVDGLSEKESQARELYFEKRALVETALEQFRKLNE